MDRQREHLLENLMLSFRYGNPEQASRCNTKLQQLMEPSIFAELEKSFDQVASGEVRFELETVEIDLGKLAEEELSEHLGAKIRTLLVEALGKAIRSKVSSGGSGRNSAGMPQQLEFALLALKDYLLKGYFPAWADSRLNLAGLLDFLLASSLPAFGTLILEVSRKSESARKRVAFLDSDTFDRIIAVLVPTEAEWIVGYRDTYLDIHRVDSRLTDSSENLKKALNLFILTFIVQDSGPKFNRFNFSHRFLKSVAAHYNLDFQLFLKEITELLDQNRIGSQLFRDFRETLVWVGEQHNSYDPGDSMMPIRPSREALIAWLEGKDEKGKTQEWITGLQESEFLFFELSRQFPGFWKSLSKTGLTHLIRVLGGSRDRQWLDLVYSYLAWSATAASLDPLETVRGIFDLAQERGALGDFSLIDAESLFFVLASHGLHHSDSSLSTTSQLAALGLKVGLSTAPSLVIRARNQARSRHGVSKETSRPVAPGHAVHALAAYLITGVLGGSRDLLSRSDLQQLVATLIRNQDEALVSLIKSTAPTDRVVLRQRLWDLLGNSTHGEISAYIKRYAAPAMQRLLRIRELLSSYTETEAKLSRRMDKALWAAFLDGIFRPEVAANSTTRLSQLRHIERLLELLLQDKKTSVVGALCVDIQSIIRIEKQSFIHWDWSIDLGSLERGLVQGLAAVTTARYAGLQLLEIPAGKSRHFLPIGIRLGWGRLLSLRIGHKSRTGRWADLSQSQLMARLELIQTISRDSMLRQLTDGQFDSKQLRAQAREILEEDLRFLVKLAFTGALGEFSLHGRIRQILAVSDYDSEPLRQFFRKNRHLLPYLFSGLFLNLNEGQWKGFSDLAARIGTAEVKTIVAGFTPDYRRELQSLASFFPSSSQLSHDLSVLAGLAPGCFAKASSHRLWRSIVLAAATRARLRMNLSQQGDSELFWPAFMVLLKRNRRAFQPGSVDWMPLFSSARLSESGKAQLRRFLHSGCSLSNYTDTAQTYSERLASALLFVKENGFIPWWSPFPSKFRLISALLLVIEHSKKEEAHLLISVFSGKDVSALAAGLGQGRLLQLDNLLSSSEYLRQFSEMRKAILARLALPTNPKQIPAATQTNLISLNLQGLAGLHELSEQGVKLEILRSIHRSREVALADAWFGRDSRIRQQLQELLAWSRFMFFGSLHPGKWRLWVFTFGFEFYVRDGNGYSETFLDDLLRYLARSQGGVNWTAVFRRLSADRDFSNQGSTALLAEIKRRFSAEQTRKAEEPATGDQVKVSNAGLILCWPFLSVLFSRLQLSAGGIIPPECQSRAVYLLQYLVYGRTDFPEYELVLNKLLIGMKPSQHLEPVELSESEKQLTVSLLSGMRSNWEKMKNASIEAIQETFLQREGTLEFGSASHVLRVPKTGVDVLLDSISWNISVVKLPWMEKSLEVKWR